MLGQLKAECSKLNAECGRLPEARGLTASSVLGPSSASFRVTRGWIPDAGPCDG